MTSHQDTGDARETPRGASPAPGAPARGAIAVRMAADNREGKDETGHTIRVPASGEVRWGMMPPPTSHGP